MFVSCLLSRLPLFSPFPLLEGLPPPPVSSTAPDEDKLLSE